MGFTLYWARKEEATQSDLNLALNHCEELLEGINVQVYDTPHVFAFNGAGGEACEPFIISRQLCRLPPRIGSCKTNLLYYDHIARNCLLVLSEKVLHVACDDHSVDCWEEAQQLVKIRLNKVLPSPPNSWALKGKG